MLAFVVHVCESLCICVCMCALHIRASVYVLCFSVFVCVCVPAWVRMNICVYPTNLRMLFMCVYQMCVCVY